MEGATSPAMGLCRVELCGGRVDGAHLFRVLAQRPGDGQDNLCRYTGMKAQGCPHGDGGDWFCDDAIGPGREVGGAPAQTSQGRYQLWRQRDSFEGPERVSCLNSRGGDAHKLPQRIDGAGLLQGQLLVIVDGLSS